MSTWNEHKTAIRNVNRDSKTWRSERDSIISIFTQAEALGINPDEVSNISCSNLCTIVKLANMTIADGDAFNLSELFSYASDLSNLNLRLIIGSNVPETLIVLPNEELGEGQFRIEVNAEQLERLQSCAKMHFHIPTPYDTRYDWPALQRYRMGLN